MLSIVIWYFLLAYPILYITFTIGLIALGVAISNDLAKVWGKDPHQIVIDEYACLLVPLYFTTRRILPLVITFVLFRVFDIIKPPPLKKLEQYPGGWGIMLDDLGAAVYTTVIILALRVVVRL